MVHLLTSRETEVLQLMAEGKKNHEIAAELGISVRTIGNYLHSIYCKINVNNRVSAALWAIRRGIVRI